MDIHQEKWDYTAMLVAENAITQEQCDTLKLSDGMNMFYSDHLASTTIDCINWGWSSWLKAKAKAALKERPSRRVTLTCAQLREAFMFGAPDKDDQEQLETEMTIVWSENGHSDKGYYCYYSDLPEEGSIFLDEVIEAQEPANV